MLFSIAFSLMLISSISVILYVNYLTGMNKKEMKNQPAQSKFRKQMQIIPPQEEDKQVFVEAV